MFAVRSKDNVSFYLVDPWFGFLLVVRRFELSLFGLTFLNVVPFFGLSRDSGYYSNFNVYRKRIEVRSGVT